MWSPAIVISQKNIAFQLKQEDFKKKKLYYVSKHNNHGVRTPYSIDSQFCLNLRAIYDKLAVFCSPKRRFIDWRHERCPLFVGAWGGVQNAFKHSEWLRMLNVCYRGCRQLLPGTKILKNDLLTTEKINFEVGSKIFSVKKKNCVFETVRQPNFKSKKIS